MNVKEVLLKEIIKNGYEKPADKKVWDISNRSFLYLTPEVAKGFLNLMDYDVYKRKIFDVEMELLKNNSGKLIKKINANESFNVIDVGCGNGEKAKEFIKKLDEKNTVRYCPIAPGDYIISVAAKNIKKAKIKNVVEMKHHKSNYENVNEFAPLMRSGKFQKNIILVLGTILASYEINDFLFKLSNGMFKGDYAIIGNAVRRGERFVEIEKYKHQSFDKWFMPLMKALGFKKGEVEYDAKFRNNRMESFYKIKKDKKIKYDGKEINFRKGDEILVFKLYKYYPKELNKFLKMYFSEVKMVSDPEKEYALALCKK